MSYVRKIDNDGPEGLFCQRCYQPFSSPKGLMNHNNGSCGDKSAKIARKRQRKNISDSTKHEDGTTRPSFMLKRQKNPEEQNPAVEENDHEDKEQISRSEQWDDVEDHFGLGDLSYCEQSEDDINTSEINDCDDESELSISIDHTAKAPPEEAKPPYRTQVGLPKSHCFQIELADILGRHRTDLKLYDEIVDLVKSHSDGNQLKFSSFALKKREKFITDLERSFDSSRMKPKDIDVELASGGKATVSVFDLEAMILSLLHNESLMKEENLVPDYDLHRGKSTEPNNHYGEVHTGDAWEPARSHHCGEHPQNMPIALIVFCDESHFDLHGTLKVTPLCFTLSCFNESAQNRVDFWRPLAFLPTLTHGKLSKDPNTSTVNVQDEHNCISAALSSLVEITKRGGIATTVKGKAVICKVWIHYIIGDICGNNRLVGHFNSNGKCEWPYRDCDCGYGDMNSPDPQCRYITHEDIMSAKRSSESASSKTGKEAPFKAISKHNIDNAFMRKGVPLSDQIHGIYRMSPPELLHTTNEGITEYMIAELKNIIGNTVRGQDIKGEIESLHQKVHKTIKRNSERDFPRGATRTGFLKNTNCGAAEKRGNLFYLLCLSHTDSAQKWLFPTLRSKSIDPELYLECMKLYLSMEEWFHETNEKEEVRSARPLIAKVIQLVHQVFPRTEVMDGTFQRPMV